MQFFDVIDQRRSVRKFQPRPVAPEKIDGILAAVLRAPSSRGSRSWELVVVDQGPVLAQLAGAKPSGGGFLKGAPLAIAVCADPAKAGPWVEDAAIAAVYIQLAAQALGLGSCWAHFRDKMYREGRSSRDRIAEILKLPDRLEVECVVALGYADQVPAPYRGADLPGDKISYNAYGRAYPLPGSRG